MTAVVVLLAGGIFKNSDCCNVQGWTLVHSLLHPTGRRNFPLFLQHWPMAATTLIKTKLFK